ncbi:MAG: hypothetical protein LKI17_06480 [Megasphaera cerevisiae]|jgi:uncharacterized protein YydD (DUF2326 family)|nr:hypothetical protein [Megasphaera cerevisiae]
MQLIKLEVIKSTTNEIIRTISFNKTGLSLIVDKTNKINSGSNIGKTTAVKVIDLCLGARLVSGLYKERDTGENIIVGQFLEDYKVIAILTCKIGNEKHVFKRSLYKNGTYEIDGEVVKNLQIYCCKLNSIVFDNKNNVPTLRQLISKFIRLDNANEAALLKFLGTYPKNYKYQAVYNYLFGIDNTKSENVNILEENEKIDKDIEAIYRKNSISSLTEFETKINLMTEEIDKFKKAYAEVTVVDDYTTKINENQLLLSNIQKLELKYARLRLKQDLMQAKIEREKENFFSVDIKMLKALYAETKLHLSKSLYDFNDLTNFHNSMVNKRIEMLQAALNEITKDTQQLALKLQEQRKIYESKYVSFNVILKDKFEEKYNEFITNKIKLETYISDFQYIKQQIEIKNNNIRNKLIRNDNSKKRNEIIERLNFYFKRLTHNIIGESYAIVFDAKEDSFPIKIVGLNGKPGTGIKKAMITCFDMAHIDLIIEKKYHMPTFLIHDKMENIDLMELAKIVDEGRKFSGQYIIPILSDRIARLGIKEDEVVLSLSARDKFFRI